MPAFAPDILALLRGHRLIKAVRVVQHDETPFGKNAPHYPHLPTAPHHFHDESGQVADSPLIGDPLADLAFVLTEIEQWVASH